MNSTPPSNSLIKFLSVACALFLGIHGASAQSTTIFTEGFENTFPGTWTVGDSNPIGTPTFWSPVNSAFGGEGTASGGKKAYCAGNLFPNSSNASPTYPTQFTAFMERGLDLTNHSAAQLKFQLRIPSIEANFDIFRARIDLPVLDRQNPGKTQFPIHRGQFIAASFHPTNNLLASGGYDNRLELWNLETRTTLGEIGHHHTAPVNVAFSPDGTHIASGQDGLVRIWKLQRPPPSLPIHTGGTSLAALSPCGKFLIPSGFTNQGATLDQTRLHSLSDGKPAGPTIHPRGLIMDAVIAQDSSWIALAISTTTDRSEEAFNTNPGSGNIQIWNPHTATPIGDPIPMPSEPRGIALHPDGSTLGVICAGVDGLEISIADHSVETLFNEDSITRSGATLNNDRCSYSPDGSTFASWGTFQYCHLWNRNQQRLLHPPYLPDSNAFDLSFHQNTITRARVASQMRVEFLDLSTGKPSAPDIPYTNWPFLTRFHPDGNHLLTAGGAETAQVWKWPQSTLACPALIHRGTIMAGTFLPNPNHLATASHDGTIRFWDHRNGWETRPPIPFQSWVLNLQLSPDNQHLISSTFGQTPISIIPLKTLFPPAPSDLSTTCLLAEIDADAEIHPGGGLAPLTPATWLAKWQTLRSLLPHLHPAPNSP